MLQMRQLSDRGQACVKTHSSSKREALISGGPADLPHAPGKRGLFWISLLHETSLPGKQRGMTGKEQPVDLWLGHSWGCSLGRFKFFTHGQHLGVIESWSKTQWEHVIHMPTCPAEEPMKGFKGFNNITDYSGCSGKCIRTDKERRREERHCSDPGRRWWSGHRHFPWAWKAVKRPGWK